jgi:hypothetical protein
MWMRPITITTERLTDDRNYMAMMPTKSKAKVAVGGGKTLQLMDQQINRGKVW